MLALLSGIMRENLSVRRVLGCEMGALYRVCSIVLVAGITAIVAASAAEPSFRYCEGGYVLERFGSQESASRRNVTGSAGTVTTFGSLEDGQGYAVQCKLEFFKSVYLYGGSAAHRRMKRAESQLIFDRWAAA